MEDTSKLIELTALGLQEEFKVYAQLGILPFTLLSSKKEAMEDEDDGFSQDEQNEETMIQENSSWFQDPQYSKNKNVRDAPSKSKKDRLKEAENKNEEEMTQAETKQVNAKRMTRNVEEIGLNRRELYPNGYPTKNFLQSFRTCIFKFLQKKMGANPFNNLSIIKEIKAKKSLNLKDYQKVFNTVCLKEILEQFFDAKILYRVLLQSRIKYCLKKIYFRKLHVFQQAFKNQEFKNIN